MLNIFSRYILILLIAIVSASGIKAQNLVPDPSFEIWTPGASLFFDQLGELDYWVSVNGSCDYHHQDHPPGNTLTALVDCPLGNGQQQCGIPY